MLPLRVSFLQLIFLNLSITEAKHVLIGDNASIDENRAGSTYIVGGENATIEEVPYLVALLYNNWLHFGGGSIIKPNFILTSARCIYWHKPEWVTIRAGSTYYDRGGQVVKVAQISKHPKFVSPTWDYDVAVLLLEKNLEFGPAIRPIEVATLNEVLPEGTIGVISGWGITHLRKPSDYTGLRKVEVPKANLDFCKKSFAFLDYEITSRMTCYGPKEGGKDACRGDAGGPLAVNGKLVGIISWGEDCGDPTYPGVYADLTHGEIQEYIFNPCAAE